MDRHYFGVVHVPMVGHYVVDKRGRNVYGPCGSDEAWAVRNRWAITGGQAMDGEKGIAATELISIAEARHRGIARVRLPKWAIKLDHLLIGELWHLIYSPTNLGINGRDPIALLSLGMSDTERIYEPYTGPLPESDEYKAEERRFVATFAGQEDHGIAR